MNNDTEGSDIISRNMEQRFARLGRSVATLVLLVLVGLLAPRTAWAREYSVDEVEIDLTVNVDGSLSVVEERSFSFDGEFNGVYWDISIEPPARRSSEAALELTNLHVEDLTAADDEFVQVDNAQPGDSGVYTVSTQQDGQVTQVMVYSPHANEQASLRISYTIMNAISAWADCGELYWAFVADGWEVASNNVTCRVHLPLPEGYRGWQWQEMADFSSSDETLSPSGIVGREIGEEDAGEHSGELLGNEVLAWGHGTANGTVTPGEKEIVYEIASVSAGRHAEARVTFPVAWLTGVTPSEEQRVLSIIAEEQQLAQSADEEQGLATSDSDATQPAVLAMLVLTGAAAVAANFFLTDAMRRRYESRHTPSFSDSFCFDVPSDDHPAVLGRVFNGSKIDNALFFATLIKLECEGALSFDAVRDEEGQVHDYLLRRGDKRPSNPIDLAAYDLLFTVFAQLDTDGSRCNNPKNDHATLLLSDLQQAARDNPNALQIRVGPWKHKVQDACNARGYLPTSDSSGDMLGSASLLLCGVVILESVYLLGLGSAGAWLAVLLLTCSIVACMQGSRSASKFVPLSPEAVELRAKLEALRRWLLAYPRRIEWEAAGYSFARTRDERSCTAPGSALLSNSAKERRRAAAQALAAGVRPDDPDYLNRMLIMAVIFGMTQDVAENLRSQLPNDGNENLSLETYSYGLSSYLGFTIGLAIGSNLGATNEANPVDLSPLIGTFLFAAIRRGDGGGHGGGGGAF